MDKIAKTNLCQKFLYKTTSNPIFQHENYIVRNIIKEMMTYKILLMLSIPITLFTIHQGSLTSSISKFPNIFILYLGSRNGFDGPWKNIAGQETPIINGDGTMRGTDGLPPSKPSFCCRTNGIGKNCCCGKAGNMSPCYDQLYTCQHSCLV